MTVAIFGAAGYQGKLIAAELARSGTELVLAGRDRERLQAAAVPGATLRLAAADDPAALAAAFSGARVVVNCAGPFTRSGPGVVRAAIEAGCHYLDTCGEQSFIKQVFDTFTPSAERMGVTVIPAMTDAGLPGDLVAHLLSDRLGPLREITCAHLITGSEEPPSRGSLRSLQAIQESFASGGLSYLDGQWRPDVPLPRPAVTFPGDAEPTPVVKFPLQEAITVPRHVTVGRVDGVAEAALAAQFSAPLPAEAIEALPEGPSAEARRAQRFTIVIDATAQDGRRLRGVVHGPDTYGSTAVIAAEAARRLSASPAKPGVLAPAQAFDPAGFLDALAPHGISWTIEPG